ncbi:MAG: AI-2E family transporter, partial [Bacteroidota bacterium]
MNPFTRTLLAILGILAVAAFVWFFRDIVVYVVVAVILTLMGRPITRLLRKVHFRGRYLPDAVSAIVAMAVLVGTFMAMISFFIPTLLQQTNNLLSVDVNTIANGLEEPINWVNELNQTYRFADDDFSVESYVQENLINVLESVQLANIANAIVGFTGDFFIGIFSVLFITFFFLKEKGLMHDMVMTLTPTKHEQKVNH